MNKRHHATNEKHPIQHKTSDGRQKTCNRHDATDTMQQTATDSIQRTTGGSRAGSHNIDTCVLGRGQSINFAAASYIRQGKIRQDKARLIRRGKRSEKAKAEVKIRES